MSNICKTHAKLSFAILQISRLLIRRVRSGCTVLGISAALSACGGGGGGGDSEANATVTPLLFKGQVIYNAPISKATVSIKDAEGRNWQTTTDDGGNYALTLPLGSTVTPPLIVRAQGLGSRWEVGNGAVASGAAPTAAGTLSPGLVPAEVDRSKAVSTPFTVYAVANDIGVTNVTPATTLIVAQLTGNRAEAAFLNLGAPGTNIPMALDRSLVLAAQTKVKQAIALLGLPASLVDNPTADALVPVNLTSVYERLVSGDVLAAAVAFFNAVGDNQVRYGCTGQAWGTMADDGKPRPSCLAGANVPVSHLVTDFVAFESPRSTDVEVRASELAGTLATGGGWKFQALQATRSERIADIQVKVVAAIKSLDDTGAFSGDAAAAQRAFASWSDTTWSNLNQRVCKAVMVKALSDLSLSYQALKMDMRRQAPLPNSDAAEGLPITIGIPSRSINRVVPSPYKDGVETDTCPILTKQPNAVRALVAAYTPDPPRPPLAPLLTSLYAAVDDLEAKIAGRASDAVYTAAANAFATAAGTLLGSYPMIDPLDLGVTNSFFSQYIETESTCRTYGNNSTQCTARSAVYSSARYKADLASKASTIPADIAAGSAQTATTALSNVGSTIAAYLIDEYEQRFDNYFDPGIFSGGFYTIVDIQGYVLDRTTKAEERALLVEIPDVSTVGYTVKGGSLELTGNFTMRREQFVLPALDTIQQGLFAKPTRITKVSINPDILPALASCYTADEACMGRLRRLRDFTVAPVAIALSGVSTDLDFAVTHQWQDHIFGAAANHDEVLPFQSANRRSVFESITD